MKKENIDKLKPQAMNWNSKNVMPFIAEEDLLRQKKALVIADVDSAERFQRLFELAPVPLALLEPIGNDRSPADRW